MFKSLILTAVTIALCASMAFPNVGTYNYANLVISYNSASHKYVVETVELINDINKAYSIGKINKEKRAEMMEHVISYNSASHKYVVETVELINDINKAYSDRKINKEKRAEMMEHVIGLLVERDNIVIAERNL